jgi:hypothetical protein
LFIFGDMGRISTAPSMSTLRPLAGPIIAVRGLRAFRLSAIGFLPAATICRARTEIETAMALIDREGEQHSRLMSLGRSHFKSAVFSGHAGFACADFSGDASFGKAMFQNSAIFYEAKFREQVLFIGATFSGDTSFGRSTFSGDASFDSATFQSSTGFLETEFQEEAQFTGIKVDRGFDMTEARFAQVPAFNQADFKQAPDLDDVTFPLPSFWRGHDADLVSQYRALRRMAIQGADYEREQMAFKGELRSRRWTVDKLWHMGLWLGLLYDGLADCGRSIVRPAIAWLLLLAVFSAIYLQHAGVPLQEWLSSCEGSAKLSRAFDLAFGNGVPLIGNSRSHEAALSFQQCIQGQTSAAVKPLVSPSLQTPETLLSAPYIFLFLLAVKNRFKIK